MLNSPSLQTKSEPSVRVFFPDESLSKGSGRHRQRSGNTEIAKAAFDAFGQRQDHAMWYMRWNLTADLCKIARAFETSTKARREPTPPKRALCATQCPRIVAPPGDQSHCPFEHTSLFRAATIARVPLLYRKGSSANGITLQLPPLVSASHSRPTPSNSGSDSAASSSLPKTDRSGPAQSDSTMRTGNRHARERGFGRTLGQLVDSKMALVAICRRCRHQRVLYPANFIERFGAGCPAIALREHFRCSSCRGRMANLPESSR